MVLRIRWSLPCAWASDTEGSKRDATEPVKALGNIISGIAIPEKTPYNDSAEEELKPLATSILGSCMVSTEEIKLIQILFRLIGKARDIIAPPFSKESALRMQKSVLSCRIANMKQENNAEENSPTNSPIQIKDNDIFRPDSMERRHKI